jgi:hypothetical protein
MSLYSILEKHSIKVCLVHPRETQHVKGRKSDVKDAQWIQRLFAAGLLRGKYRGGRKTQRTSIFNPVKGWI